MTNPQWLLTKSKLRNLFSPSIRRDRSEPGVNANEHLDAALTIAAAIVVRQSLHLLLAWPRLGFRLTEKAVLSIEVQFLWGVFHEVVIDGPKLPTDAHDRIAQMICGYLTKVKECDVNRALADSRAVYDLYNQADATFDLIERHGRQAYRRPNESHHFVEIASLLHTRGLPPTLYANP